MDTLSIEKMNNTIDSVLTVVNDISKHIQLKESNCCDIMMILLLILLTGFIGGLVNYLTIKEKEEQTWRSFFHSILLGIIGASLIPLFLQLTSSKLLESCGVCYTTFLVLGGYMLIAAIFAKRLIDNLGKKIFNIEDINNAIDKSLTEPDAKEELPEKEIEEIKNKISSETLKTATTSGTKLSSAQKDQAIAETNKLLSNMQGSRYKFRTLSGISKSTELDESKVFVILNILKSKNIIKEVIRNSKTYFKLTELGQSLRLLK